MIEGAGRGVALVPGKADESLLIGLMEGKQKPIMPRRKSRQPSAAEVAAMRAWVEAGARDDRRGVGVAVPELAGRKAMPTALAAVAYWPGGDVVAVCGRGEVVVLEAGKGQGKGGLGGQGERVRALTFCRDGARLARARFTVGEGAEVRRVRWGEGGGCGPEVCASGQRDVMQPLAFRRDGTLLARCG